MSTQTGQIMKNLFVNVLMVLLFTCMVLPHSEAASASLSGSMSVTVTPTFSSSLSGSYSQSQTYSQSSALTQTFSTSITRSYLSVSGLPTFSATVGTIVPPPAGYNFQNRCPNQATTVCPFWMPNVYPSYKITIMDTEGDMYTIDNIVVPPGQIPQYPVSLDSTDGFLQPGGTYRFDLYGCTSPGVCSEAFNPLVVTLPPKKKFVCNPNYICRVVCNLVGGQAQCAWQNTGVLRYKRAILEVMNCFQLPSYTRVTPTVVKVETPRYYTFKNLKSRLSQPYNLSIPLPPGCICETQLIVRYHPIQPKELRFKYYYFT